MVCCAMLGLSIIMLMWVGYDSMVNKVYTHNIVVAILNTLLFVNLVRIYRKKIKENKGKYRILCLENGKRNGFPCLAYEKRNR